MCIRDRNISDLTGIQDFDSLSWLNCHTNSLISLDLSQNTVLSSFDCRNNQITCLNLKNGNSGNLDAFFIENFDMAVLNNPLSCVEVDDPNENIPCLGSSVCTWNTITSTLTFSTNCNYSAGCFPSVSNSARTYVPDDNFEAYLEANNMGDGISGNDSVFTSNISGVISLNVDSLNISSLTGLEDFTNLAVLSCRYNSLTSLDISQNTNLYKLNCRYNQISALDVTQNTALKMLNCNDNSLTALDVSQNTALINLGLEDNQLTTIDVSNNSALKYFICGDNQLTSLDVSNNTALEYLAFHANQISSIDVSNLSLIHI